MRPALNYALFCTCTAIATLLLCAKQPSDPAEDPNNAKLELLVDDADTTVVNGAPLPIKLAVSYPVHVESIHLTSTCGGFDTTVHPDPFKTADTLFFDAVFTREGSCMIYADAMFYERQFEDRTASLPVRVLPKPTELTLTRVPPDFATLVGRADTLLFIASAGGDSSSMRFSFTSEPLLDAEHFYAISSAAGSTGQCVFAPDTTGSFTVTASVSSEALSDSATIRIRVYDSLVFASVHVPRSIVAGDTDTLIFTISQTGRPELLWLELINSPATDAAMVKVLPSAADSLLIAVSPAAEGTLPVVVRITNGEVSDTSWFTVKAVDPAYAVWNALSGEIEAIENTPLMIDLRQYLFTTAADGLSFSADSGWVSHDTLWKWMPPWGCDSAITVMVRAEREEAIYLFYIELSVQPADSTAPELRLVDTSLFEKTIAVPHIAIEAKVKDTLSGVGQVTFTVDAKTVDVVAVSDSIYIARIDNLASGIRTPVTITACDRSMRKNSSRLIVHVTYDSTVTDEQPPAVSLIYGPADGERVTTSSGRITCRIVDDSGVDSVWWTLNGSEEEELTMESEFSCTLRYILTAYGVNRIVIHALDGSRSHNRDSMVVALVYNTTPRAVTLEEPSYDTVEVDTLVTFAWSGGEDRDGDTVFYRVLYDTSDDSLGLQSDEVTDSSVTLSAANKLLPGTKYYWQVIAYSKEFPDTNWSDVYPFTTKGAKPLPE
ncbi:MAG: fibronectin type III domain-containing protein [Chitinispirillaceae bacterium]|nr:fibronectin type III domain-containing protein [Chitinispirillaceae bacterium]